MIGLIRFSLSSLSRPKTDERKPPTKKNTSTEKYAPIESVMNPGVDIKSFRSARLATIKIRTK